MSATASIIEMVGTSTAEDQARLFKNLRDQHGGSDAYYDDMLGVVVLGYDATKGLLARQGKGVESSVYRPEKFSGDQGDLMRMVADMMISVDGEVHKGERRPVTAPFTRRRLMEQMAEPVVDIASELLNSHRNSGNFDLVNDFAGVFPVRVIMKMLGIPAEHFELLKRLSDEIAPAATNPLAASADVAKKGAEGLKELRGFYEQQFSALEATDSPYGQAMQRLMTAPNLTEEQRFSNFVLLFIAGHETTSRVISGTMAALLSDPAKLARVKDDPQLIHSVVDEGLRWCSPFQAIFRRTTEAIDLGDGVVLGNGHGSRAALILAAANRDPKHFQKADEFQVDRYDRRFGIPPEEGLAFGLGAHRCLGAELAKLELQVALQMLVQLPGLELNSKATVEWDSTLTFRGPKSLPITFAPHTADMVKAPDVLVPVPEGMSTAVDRGVSS